MKKGLFVLSMPLFVFPLIGCNRAIAPTSLKIYGLSATMRNSNYIFYADFGDGDNIDKRVSWSVDKPEIASIDSNGILTTKNIANNAEIKITAKSKKDGNVVDTKTVNVVATDELSEETFLEQILQNEKGLAALLDDEPISANLAEGDYIMVGKKKFTPIADKAKFAYKKFGSGPTYRIDGSNYAELTDKASGSNIIMKKSIGYEHAEYISTVFESYKEVEEKGLGLYNCFRYSNNSSNYIYGYYTFLFATLEDKSEFTYREFNEEGFMITVVNGKGDDLTTNLHFSRA